MFTRYHKKNRKNMGIRVNHTCSGSDCLKVMYSAGMSCKTGFRKITG